MQVRGPAPKCIMTLVDARFQVGQLDCFRVGHGNRRVAVQYGRVDLGSQFLISHWIPHQVVQNTVDRNGSRISAGKSKVSLVNTILHMQKSLESRRELTRNCVIPHKCVHA